MHRLAFLSLGILALACRFTEGPVARVATPSPAILTATAPSPSVVDPTQARPSATPITPTPSASCRVPSGSPSVPDFAGARSIAPLMLSFLNQGGSPSQLFDALQDSDRIMTQETGMAAVDLSGDGAKDLAFSVLDLEAGFSLRPGILLLFECREDHYQLSYTSSSSTDLSAPIIHASADLNGDGVADMLAGRRHCGAHTCFEQIEVLIWNGTTLENRLGGISNDLPSPQIEIHRDQDGPAEIAVTAIGIGSVGAGPFRPLTRVWSWSAEAFAFLPIHESLHPSSMRIHVLHDADDAARAGNLDAALAYYQSVIADESLDDWLAGAEGHAQLAGYARFRRVVTIIQIGDQASAQQELESLRAAFPSDAAGSAYADLAEVFWLELRRSQEQGGADHLAAACAAAQAYAVTHGAEILDPLYYGYANRSYGPTDICPFAAAD